MTRPATGPPVAQPGRPFVEAQRVRPNITYSHSHSLQGKLVAAPPNNDPGRYVALTDTGPTRSFADVVQERRSIRRLGPPTIQDVGTVLARSGLTRERAVDSSGAPVMRRPNPSAGGLHPLTLVLLASHVDGIESGEWVLDADAAALRPGRSDADAVREALQQIARAARVTEPLPAAIVVVAEPSRTLAKYSNGQSLIWRDTGALLMLVHLAATDLGLASCIIGTCGVLYPGDDSGEMPVDVGAVIVGRPQPREGLR